MQCTVPKIVLQLTVTSASLDVSVPLWVPSIQCTSSLPGAIVVTSQLQLVQISFSTGPSTVSVVSPSFVVLPSSVELSHSTVLNVVVSTGFSSDTAWITVPAG